MPVDVFSKLYDTCLNNNLFLNYVYLGLIIYVLFKNKH